MPIIAGALVVLFLVLAGSCSMVSVVEPGHRGVKAVWGKVEDAPLTEGIYFNSPIMTSIVQMDIRTQKWSGETTVYTKDVQQASVKYTYNVSLQGDKAAEIYRTVGKRYEETLIPQVVEGGLKNSFGKWEAVDVIANREKLRSEVQLFLKENLAARGVIVERFDITNIDYSNEFENAVEAKVVAIQQAEEQKNKTVQVEEVAKQKVISAEAEARAMKIKSDALSQNQNLVAYEAVAKWKGEVPAVLNINSGSLLNIPGSILEKK